MLAQTYIHISDLVMKSAKTLDERLVDILKVEGGRKTFADENVQIYDIHNFNGFSGLNYWVNGQLIGQLHIASLNNGNYTIYKRIFLEGELTEIYDYYDQNGNFMYSSGQLSGQVVFYNSINMDPKSPFVNHIYNILSYEYNQAKSGYSQTARIVYLESVINGFLTNDEVTISAEKTAKDESLVNIEKEILRIEKDPILKWDERQSIFSSLKDVRKNIIETKRRAHKRGSLNYTLPLLASDLKTKAKIIKQRPGSNFRGMLYKYTFGNIIWFADTVKANLGLSIAMAIYGPFTFYFITQPMNPHAMWAVGKVRNAYIQTVGQIEDMMKEEQKAESKKITALKNAQDQMTDTVSTQQAAIKKAAILPASKVSWDDRMSNFKAMQIAYEGNMVFAARMGRVEQMETQFSFSLTAESAWRELERYNRSVNATLEYNTNLDSRFKTFLQRELVRNEQLQIYIWKKMAQYFLDHPYIIVDQANEQVQRDYYVGKSFVLMQEMTEKLSKKSLSSDMPTTHAKVQALAEFYKQSKKQGASVMDTLRQNSKLFAQKDIFNTKELRDYMHRHWEVLFLQQNKKQEASSFGLQTYTWSIKNAIWTIQSVISAKREELGTLAYKFNLNNQNTAKVKADKNVSDLLESMMHMMTLEYVSIKEEFSKNLKNDEEATLREEVINNIKEYLVDRDELFNSTLQVANTEARAATTI